MSGPSNSVGDAFGKAFNAVGQPFATLPKAALEAMFGGDPVAMIKADTKSAIWDIIALPGRVAKHTLFGAIKGTGKLLWAGVKNLPIWPVWHAERQQVAANTKQELHTLSDSIKLADSRGSGVQST